MTAISPIIFPNVFPISNYGASNMHATLVHVLSVLWRTWRMHHYFAFPVIKEKPPLQGRRLSHLIFSSRG